MNIYVYSDESGVFDKLHNEFFVYGGIILLGKEEKEDCSRRYLNAEKAVRTSENFSSDTEVKATTVSNKNKSKLYRSLNHIYKFGAVIHQPTVYDRIYAHKKTKQRYLDYAYKIAVRRCFESLIHRSILDPKIVQNIYFYVDEHTTATDGRYELREGLEQELKIGTFNDSWNSFHSPLFPTMFGVNVELCNSESNRLVRAADIVSNHIYYMAVKGIPLYNAPNELHVVTLP